VPGINDAIRISRGSQVCTSLHNGMTPQRGLDDFGGGSRSAKRSGWDDSRRQAARMVRCLGIGCLRDWCRWGLAASGMVPDANDEIDGFSYKPRTRRLPSTTMKATALLIGLITGVSPGDWRLRGLVASGMGQADSART
jgi:hypothetical protein